MLCRLVLGRPRAVTAVSARLRKPDLPSEDTAVVVLTYPRAVGLLEASWNQIGGEPALAMIVYGERGTLLVHQPRATHEGEHVGRGHLPIDTPPGGRPADPPPKPNTERDRRPYFLLSV